VGDGDDASRGSGGPGTNESPPSIATSSPAHTERATEDLDSLKVVVVPCGPDRARVGSGIL
jgi:hypothetical protein